MKMTDLLRMQEVFFHHEGTGNTKKNSSIKKTLWALCLCRLA
jgi:hypothetical protein